jgi:serine/threonine protein kinase
MTTERRLLHGRYRVLSELGTGGQGSVWLAEDTVLERRVALKELLPHNESTGIDESRARALVEARALARVRHRCIVRIHDIFFAGKDPWLVMEYIKGRSLAEIISAGHAGERALAAIGLQAVEGLQAVHDAKVVHRDVKPANILAGHDGAIYLVDFGIAKITEELAGGARLAASPITGRGRVLGTPEYIAPEQITGQAATPASDLWSLGVTLYFALEGRTPFARGGGQPAHAIRAAILYEDPYPPACGGSLAELVLRLLEKDPAKRPKAGEVARVLESVLTGAGGTSGSKPAPRPESTPALNATLVYTTARTRPLDDAELSRREMAHAVRVVTEADSDSGIAALLAKPSGEAARILADCSFEVAAELIAGIAATSPDKAGAILEILSVTRSGRLLDYLPSVTGARVVASLLPAQRARVLSESDARTAAEVIMALAGEAAGQLIAAMPERRAVTVLSHVRPRKVAEALRAMDGGLRGRLLDGLSADFRALVQRHL